MILRRPMNTDELLAHLRASKTDIGRFVAAMLREHLPQLVVPANAVRAWQEREPQTWALVCDWLSEQGKSVRVVESVSPCQGLTRRGVLDAQMRVHERLGIMVTELGMVLDPGSPLWFDGRLELPKPGEPWKMKLSSGGATSSVEFTPAEVDAFLGEQPPEVVLARLRRAVDALRPPRPQERGLA